MKEVLCLECDDFILTVWCNGVEKRLDAYQKMLQGRNQFLRQYVIYCLGDFKNLHINFPIVENLPLNNEPLKLSFPIFFDNLQYQFEWEFKDGVEYAKVIHYHQLVNEAFRFKTRRLVGNINTNNDIGWFTLPICYIQNGIEKSFQFKFEILPTKIDLHSDMPVIYRKIDHAFPLLRFNFFGKTEQQSSENQKYGNFSLFWLAHFNHLREKFIHSIKVITYSPHQRLQQRTAFVKADRLIGKQTSRQLEKVRNDIKNGRLDKHYQITPKYLSIDTPENRFIKWISTQTQQKIRRTLYTLSTQQHSFSEHLSDNLVNWITPLEKLEKQSFLQRISPEFLQKASLVLQQKTGYRQVYYIWQELKIYLDFFENTKTISMKSVAELYEIWCFITLKEMLISLGFEEKLVNKVRLKQDVFSQYHLTDSLGGAFHFQKGEIKIRLAHEPIFRKNSAEIKTYWVAQKPDILLEVTFPNNQKYIWLFDAKYRIAFGKDLNQEDPNGNDTENEKIANLQDLAPEDALNQMHRYRDALIHISKNDLVEKSRPVFGAFALYPGCFNQEKQENPYKEVIEEIGIGAFALLPNENQTGQKWLMDFLSEKLSFDEQKLQEKMDELYLENTARIPSFGMSQTYYRNLVLTIRLGNDRTPEYINKFKEGDARWYHTKTDIFAMEFNHKIISELHFLAISYPTDIEQTNWVIDKIYPVLSVEIKKREDLILEQTGSNTVIISNEYYYLFKLTKPMRLDVPILDVPFKRFRESVKLTTLEQLEDVDRFDKIKTAYSSVLDKSLNN